MTVHEPETISFHCYLTWILRAISCGPGSRDCKLRPASLASAPPTWRISFSCSCAAAGSTPASSSRAAAQVAREASPPFSIFTICTSGGSGRAMSFTTTASSCRPFKRPLHNKHFSSHMHIHFCSPAGNSKHLLQACQLLYPSPLLQIRHHLQ